MKLVVALLVGAFGTMLPLPTFRTEPAMATETRRPLSEGATVQPAPPQPPVTDEGPAASDDPAATTTVPGDAAPTTSTTGPTSTSAPSTTTTTPSSPLPDTRVRVAEDTRDFDLVGLTLPAPPTTPVLLRTADATGTWSEWHDLEFEDAPAAAPAPVPGVDVPVEPDEGNPGAHSSPVWVGDATRYELDMAYADAEVADVHLVYETTRRVEVETTEAGADPAAPPIWGRDAWGARAPRSNPSYASELKAAILHHTADTNNYGPGDVPALLRSIQAYHMDANGWDDIAYNFLVDKFGRIWEGRAGGTTNAVIGAHARGFNTGTFGVSMLGNYDQVGPTGAALEAVVQVMAWKFAVHDVDPRYPTWIQAGAGSPVYPPGTWIPAQRIFSHRDVGQTACPGAYLYPYLDTIRGVVNQRYPALAPPGAVVAGNFVGGPETDVFLRQPGVQADTLIAASSVGYFGWRWYWVDGSFTGVPGDFDGNGYDDIYWYAPGPGTDYVWLSDGNEFWQSTSAANASLQQALVGDYDGDGDDDIYWYAPGPVEDALWVAQAGRFYWITTPQVTTAHTPVTGNFTGDRKDEILWGSSPSWLWQSTGAAMTFTARTTHSVVGWFAPVSGDFDADGDDDVMWYSPGSGSDWLWSAGGGTFSATQTWPVSDWFTGISAGNIDGSGGEDVLWYASPGADWLWRSPGGRPFSDSRGTNIGFR